MPRLEMYKIRKPARFLEKAWPSPTQFFKKARFFTTRDKAQPSGPSEGH